MKSMLLEAIQQALSDGGIIFNYENSRSIHLSSEAGNFYIIEANGVRTQVVSKKTSLRAPVGIRKSIQKVPNQLAASEWNPLAILYEVAQSDLCSEIACNRIRIEPGELDDLRMRLRQQGRRRGCARGDLHTAERAGCWKIQIIGITLTCPEVDQFILTDQREALGRYSFFVEAAGVGPKRDAAVGPYRQRLTFDFTAKYRLADFPGGNFGIFGTC